MGVYESVDIGIMILQFLILFGAIVVLAEVIISSTFSAAAMHSASVRAGLIAGCMSVSEMHNSTEIEIAWNLLPVNLGATENLLIAVTDKIGWVAFPGIILDFPYFPKIGEDDASPLFELEDLEGWVARGNAIEIIEIYHNGSGRGMVVK